MVQFGKPVGAATGSSSYFPIALWHVRDFIEFAGDRPLGEVVSERANGLAETLTQHSEGPLFNVIQYAIREIARNSIEHSQGEYVSLLGQFWPTRNEAQIVVFDDGIGISENLYENEYIDVANNLAGLKLSLLPGITGVPRSTRITQDEEWGNSGFGLYVTSALCGKLGEFHLLSEGDYLALKGHVQYHASYPYRGTGVCLCLKLDDYEVAEAEIGKIINRGEATRSELMQDVPVQASAASKMLASQFKRKIER